MRRARADRPRIRARWSGRDEFVSFRDIVVAPCVRSTCCTWAPRASICCFAIDDVIVDPGPESTARDAARGARRRAAARDPAHPHPPRPRRRDRRARAAVARPPRSTCTSAARGTWSTRRGWWPAPSGCTATTWTRAVGRDRPRARGEHARPHRRRARVEGAFASSTRPATPPTTSAYLHEPTGTAFVGDVAGVRIAADGLTLPPTPPPDIDVEAWQRSIDLVAGLGRPSGSRVTHFGATSDAAPARARCAARCDRWAAGARAGRGRASKPRSRARDGRRRRREATCRRCRPSTLYAGPGPLLGQSA